MAQRWMQAKMLIGKSHGFAKSGAGRPLGYVSEDRDYGRVQERDIAPPKERHTERVGQVVREVTPVLRKAKGVTVVLKARDKMPRRLQAKYDAVIVR